MNGNTYLSLPQAARAARVSQRELLAAIHRHELPARLYERRWWISPDALVQWCRSRRQLQRTGGGTA